MSDRNAATQSSNRRSKSSNGVPCEQSMTIKELVTNDLTVEDVACCVVRNLSREVDRRLLAELFFQVGPVLDVCITDDKRSAYVYFPDLESPDFASKILDQIEIFGRKIRVEAVPLRIDESMFPAPMARNGRQSFDEMMQVARGRLSGRPPQYHSSYGHPSGQHFRPNFTPTPPSHFQGDGLLPLSVAEATRMGMNPMNPAFAAFTPSPRMQQHQQPYQPRYSNYMSSTPQGRYRR